VKLHDEGGTVIAVASLEPGNPATLGEAAPFACQFTFRFDAVPDAKFYQVVIGGHEGPTMSASDLEANGWEYDPLRL